MGLFNYQEVNRLRIQIFTIGRKGNYENILTLIRHVGADDTRPPGTRLAAQMYFDLVTLSMESIWLGHHFYDQSIVVGKSWVVDLPQDTPKTAGGQPKKWTVYTP